ncbi:hypothetical protein [Deinococcus sp. PEB2-63]
MEPDLKQELQRLSERISGVSAAMETGFEGLRKDVHYLGRTNTPVLVVAGLALILSICSLFVAMDNRSLILTVNAQTAKNTRDLENITPLIFQPYAPTPLQTEPEK